MLEVEEAANDLPAFVNHAFRGQRPRREDEHGTWQRVLKKIGRQAILMLLGKSPNDCPVTTPALTCRCSAPPN